MASKRLIDETNYKKVASKPTKPFTYYIYMAICFFPGLIMFLTTPRQLAEPLGGKIEKKEIPLEKREMRIQKQALAKKDTWTIELSKPDPDFSDSQIADFKTNAEKIKAAPVEKTGENKWTVRLNSRDIGVER